MAITNLTVILWTRLIWLILVKEGFRDVGGDYVREVRVSPTVLRA